ncbi:MAG: RNA polymerase factor sigma-54 [Pigmentiphaga sp.]|uniref:RNA polymerase factor sigma-54 n=1 Tax=Pigmentiphaga sp. TaxID=1977564 RepID=UPI0029A883CC|nr:RNA polymerase factor sigma-54 [Pigmentiphaga sp.]MDX3904064.1 RNA polymerase factor sigma-54 [Pigmentiphaga sp.]
MVQATYDMRVRQQLSLTPRLQQSVKLLQMSALEFTQELQQAIANNPFLEEDDQDPAIAKSEESVLPVDRNADDPRQIDGNDSRESEPPAFDGESYPGSYPTSRVRDDDGEDRPDVGQWSHSSMGLHDYLHQQLCGYRLGDRDRLLAEIIIEALDEDGYLRQDFDELAASLPMNPMPTRDEWMVALTLVQHLDTPGLAARSLGECLHLQLAAYPADTPGRSLAIAIVDDYLDLMARRETAELRRRLGCNEEELGVACRLIRSLTPRPGLAFSEPETDHIIPDVIVRKIKNKWVITTNPAVMPKARLHQAYANLFRKARCDDRAPLAQELQEARWLIRNVEQRFATIQRVAEAIVAHQRTFFDYGEIALKPLVLRKVAEELDLHESTVSRATNNKYMATPRGVFEFKHFFSRELATDTGGRCSAAAVRALIRDMIAAENRRDPLSDVSLTRMLAEQGVVVARRTVTKYRDLMKIPPAELRKQP